MTPRDIRNRGLRVKRLLDNSSLLRLAPDGRARTGATTSVGLSTGKKCLYGFERPRQSLASCPWPAIRCLPPEDWSELVKMTTKGGGETEPEDDVRDREGSDVERSYAQDRRAFFERYPGAARIKSLW